MSSTIPRYTAPERSRLRLIAALGVLTATAIAAGGLASVFSGETEVEHAASEAGESLVESSSPSPFDPSHMLELEVERAEQTHAAARAALREARLRGDIDPSVIDALERRLDALAPMRLPSPASPDAVYGELGAVEPPTGAGRSDARPALPDTAREL